MSTEIASLVTKFTANVADFEKGAKSVQSKLKDMSTAAGNVASKLNVVAAPLIGIGVASVVAGAQFESSMKNIQAVTGATNDEISKLSGQLLEIGANSVAGPQAVADAYYDIAGGVADASIRLDTLKAAIATAEAGQANLGATTKGLISIMNSYKLKAEDAAFASDVLTRTVGMGVGSMDEFVGAISPITGIAASAGIKLQELGTDLAFMTTKGMSADQAATQLKASIVALLNPNKEMADLIKKAGYESGEAAIKHLGLQGALEAVNKAAGGNSEKMTKALGSVEALQGATALLSKDYGEFAKTFENGLKGATDAARATQLQSFNAQLALLKNELFSTGITIGLALLPTLKDLVRTFSNGTESLKPYLPQLLQIVGFFLILATAANVVNFAVSGISTGFTLLAGAWGIVKAAGIALAPGLFAQLSTGISMTASSLGGMLLALAPILIPLAVAVGLVKAFTDNWLGFGDTVRKILGDFAKLINSALGPGTVFWSVVNGAIDLVQKLAQAVSDVAAALGRLAGGKIPGTGVNGGSGGGPASAAGMAGGSGGIMGGGGSLSLHEKAGGGQMMSAIPYLVGERGPEIFTPKTSGTMIPNHQISNFGRSSGGGGNNFYIGNLNVNGVDDPASLMDKLQAEAGRRNMSFGFR